MCISIIVIVNLNHLPHHIEMKMAAFTIIIAVIVIVISIMLV